MRGIIVFLKTLHFAQRPFFLRKKILIEEPAVLTNLYFQLHNLLATGARPDPPPLHKEGGDDEEEDEEEKGEGEEEEEEEDEILKSHIKSIEEEIKKLCQGMLLILYYCALYITERFS